MGKFSENWNDEQRKQVFTAITSTLDDYELDWQSCYVNDFIDDWYKAKLPLLEILSNHPNWSQENLAVVQTVPYVRKLHITDAVENFSKIICWVDSYLYSKYCSNEDYGKAMIWRDNTHIYWDMINKSLPDDYNGTVNEETINLFRGWGMYDGKSSSIKLTTIFRKHFDKIKDILDEWGYYNKENKRLVSGYEYYFNILANALKPTQIMRNTLLSLHPADYLRMSIGHDWDSCHTIPDGGWSAGCFSYALDSTSLVFYTVEDYNKYYWDGEKIHRQMFFYGDGVLHQSRFYPQHKDCDKDAIYYYRSVVQDIFATALSEPNMWIVKKEEDQYNNNGHPRKWMKSGIGFCQYPDYDHYYSGLATTSLLKTYLPHAYNVRLTAGAPCYNLWNKESYVYHDRASTYNHIICANCGRVIPDYDDYDDPTYYETDDGYVCTECFNDEYVACEECGCYFNCNNNGRQAYTSYGIGWVCQDCLDNNYLECSGCDMWVRENRAIVDGNGNAWCPSCAEDVLEECEECEEFYPSDEITQVFDCCGNARNLCESCIREADNFKKVVE